MASVFRVRLLATALAGSAVFAATASFAQSTPTTPTGLAARPPVAAADYAAPEEIIVTGSLFKRSDLELTSPVTEITSADLETRGFQSVQGNIQSISANNGPALTNSFTANGAFAGGASAVSLRGLTTSSTLVLFDGLRASYYPLADDGTRNFVDLNTIPDEIVDRVQILKDGASSLYGADAVAGVVNIITKKNIQGLLGNAEAGISERGDSGNHRVSLTYGYGDLSKQGFNVYISAHYLDSEELYNRQRDYPYNTADQSRITYNGVSGPNNIANGTNSDDLFAFSTAPNVLIVRPANATNTAALGRYQLLNPAAGCQGLTPYTLSDTQYANNPTAPRTVCQQDIVRDFGQIEPKQDRWGIAGTSDGQRRRALRSLRRVQLREQLFGLYRPRDPGAHECAGGHQFPAVQQSGRRGQPRAACLRLPARHDGGLHRGERHAQRPEPVRRTGAGRAARRAAVDEHRIQQFAKRRLPYRDRTARHLRRRFQLHARRHRDAERSDDHRQGLCLYPAFCLMW